jgi:hypothetical protein
VLRLLEEPPLPPTDGGLPGEAPASVAGEPRPVWI